MPYAIIIKQTEALKKRPSLKRAMPPLNDETSIVNGINKTAILRIKEAMEIDPKLGDRKPVTIKAFWEQGVVYDASGKLECHPPPEIQKGDEIKYPTVNSFCPLVSTGCFGLILMMQAAEREMQFESFHMHMSANADLSCFYKFRADIDCPWSNGVQLDIDIKGPQLKEEVDVLAKFPEKHCPSVEIMRRSFPVDVIIQRRKVNMENVPVYYDMDKYNIISKQWGPHMVKQSIFGDWHCHNESKEFPDALVTFAFDQEGGVKLPMGCDAPIGSGTWVTPVQACFFGGLSQHMHTIAARLYALGYLVKSMQGIFTTEMNERITMAVEKERRYIFPSGGMIELEIETDAPDDILDRVQFEAEQMSPAFMNWTNSIPINVSIKKE